jgi:two-component system phosphate regulon sensor histidine kinase PhoR
MFDRLDSLSLRARMVVTAVLAAAVALAVVLALAGPGLGRRAKQDAYTSLEAEARLMARVVEAAFAGTDRLRAIDAVVDAAAPEVKARVTIVGTDGRVLADSTLSGDELLRMENHGSRPEVQAALRGEIGRAERRSATVGTDLLYAAVPVRHSGIVVGVSRLSRPVTSVQQQGWDLWRAAAQALALALLATGVLSAVLSVSLGRSLREIMDTARDLARGNVGARIPVRRADELGELARILNDSAGQLQARMAELARDRSRTEAILSAMDDGVLAVDHDGRIIVANPSLLRAFNLTDVIGRHHLEVVRHATVSALIEHVRTAGARRRAEVSPARGGRTFTVTGVPFPGEVGGPDGVVLTFSDTTEQRRLELVRRDFVANASHELRTPLTSIRGYVEALEDGAVEDAETANAFIEKIRTHAERMSALVADLLELSRLESGALAPTWGTVSPRDVAGAVVEAFAGLATWKHLTLEHVDRQAPDVTTDAEWLRRLLENLVDNAIKYTPAGGRIRVVTSTAPPGGAQIEVIDNGPGIAAEHRGRIFERFYRVDKSRSREVGGTGLGLSIVKHLAESLGASVSVDSGIGKGTRFTVSVPSAPPRQVMVPADRSAAAPGERQA